MLATLPSTCGSGQSYQRNCGLYGMILCVCDVCLMCVRHARAAGMGPGSLLRLYRTVLLRLCFCTPGLFEKEA